MPNSSLTIKMQLACDAIELEESGLGGRRQIIELVRLCYLERIHLDDVLRVISFYADRLDSPNPTGKMAA